MTTTPNWLTNSPLIPKDKIDEKKMKELKSASKQFNMKPGVPNNTEPTETGKLQPTTNYKEQCDKLRKSDQQNYLSKIKSLEEQIKTLKEQLSKPKTGLFQKAKESFRNRFSRQRGGKRKKTKRRRNKKTKINRKTQRRRN